MVLGEGAAAAGVGGPRLTPARELNSVESWRSFLLTSACSFGSWDAGAAFPGSEAGNAAVLSLVPGE